MSASPWSASVSVWSSFDTILSPLMLSRLMVNRESRLGRQTSPLSAPGITREMMSRLDCLLIIPVLKSLLDVLLAIFLLGTLTDPLLLPLLEIPFFLSVGS